ncbi:FAD-binding domain-containing protein [Hesseltinella vesiculosa]|uniref:FAD-binding domain-containing protein n=1 Tax=Hesseltinella vesiculosa TaxID=101127 RepID=A0A1X2GGQ8_9FUNG|nr:FAD-binding domain-containing protein [Hesseltinella vesiculosa]
MVHQLRTMATKVLTPLTRSKHPHLKRGPFKKLQQEDINYFRTVLGSNQITTETDAHNIDLFNLYRGSSKLCLFPKSTEQVSSILAYCNDQHLAVVPQGGNTGVSGGAVPVFDEIVVNMSKFNRIRAFDDLSGIATVDGGVILEQLDQYLAPKGYTVPLDLGAKGSCQIAGNVSTNAGGLRLLRFGNLHGNVLGLEVVLPDGTILDDLSTLRKNNTGYDLKQLFIGAEGTLGMVTGVSLLTPIRPSSVNVTLVAMSSFEKVLQAYVSAKDHLGEILSAFEFWDMSSIKVVESKMEMEAFPVSQSDAPFYALVETQGSRDDHDKLKLEHYLESLMAEDVVLDGVLAQDDKQMRSLWQWREKIPEAIVACGPALTYDVSMDIRLFKQMVDSTMKHFEQKGLIGNTYQNIIGFGHIGDGNLHIMANMTGFDHNAQEVFDKYVFEWALANKGSISAEHGIGIHKVDYMERSKRGKNQLPLMNKIKNTLDPRGIMNPYKLLPE